MCERNFQSCGISGRTESADGVVSSVSINVLLKVRSGRTIDTLVDDGANLEVNSLANWQPVQLS